MGILEFVRLFDDCTWFVLTDIFTRDSVIRSYDEILEERDKWKIYTIARSKKVTIEKILIIDNLPCVCLWYW